MRLQEDSESKSEDVSQFKVVQIQAPKLKDLDESLKTLKKHGGYSGLKQMKYEKRNDEEKQRIEEYIIFTLHKFRTTPVEVAQHMEDELYKRIDSRWKYSLASKKKMRERSLAITVETYPKEESRIHCNNNQRDFE